jgi:hypothetical protein
VTGYAPKRPAEGDYLSTTHLPATFFPDTVLNDFPEGKGVRENPKKVK